MAKNKPNGNGANLGFEEKLWQTADKLRNNMDAAEYKHVVLGLIFLKYISDAFNELHDKLENDPEGLSDPEDQDEYRAVNVSIFGQESNQTTWRLCKMNLAIRGIDANVHWGDSFHNNLHKDLKSDFILANPPFNDSDWKGQLLREDKRWKFGVPPAGNANYSWVQHFIHHLSPTGIAGFVLANGSMSSNTSGEGEIRNELIADMFNKVHFVEKWGRGIELILSKEPQTTFKEVADMFVAVFKRKNIPEIPGTTPKTTPKTDERIILLIKENPSITKEELAQRLNITLDRVKYQIRKLRKKGLISWKGPSKGGYWEVIR